ncbi:MAG: TlyA family RNA methyltransferase [Saprospiraceae bacterium]|nr:TlyA family RNA methyltransferase [Saprospiraceae bacterium]
MSVRIDTWLTQHKYFESREKARIAIEEGAIEVNGTPVYKASFKVTLHDQVEIKAPALRYVSRGGLKLEKAIRAFQLDFANKIILDVGASTGGFTDCALQHGAAKVFAVDVGSGQLHPSLRAHPQLRWWEHLHIRDLTLEMLGEAVDIILVDVSFISLRHIFPYLKTFLKKGGFIITLIKPQFELEEKVRLKKGIIKDEKLRQQVLEKVTATAQEQGFVLKRLTNTDAEEDKKNVEYLAWWE